MPIHSSGRVVRQLVFSPVVSSDLGLSVSPSLCLSPARGRASPHPPPLSFLFQERDLHGVLDGRTDGRTDGPLPYAPPVRREGGRASGSPADLLISSVGAKKQLLRGILGPAENIFRGQRNLPRVA